MKINYTEKDKYFMISFNVKSKKHKLVNLTFKKADSQI